MTFETIFPWNDEAMAKRQNPKRYLPRFVYHTDDMWGDTFHINQEII